MGQILHGSATTIEAVRRAIQNSQASLRELAARYGINPKTVAKWRRRGSPVCLRSSSFPMTTVAWPRRGAVPAMNQIVISLYKSVSRRTEYRTCSGEAGTRRPDGTHVSMLA